MFFQSQHEKKRQKKSITNSAQTTKIRATRVQTTLKTLFLLKITILRTSFCLINTSNATGATKGSQTIIFPKLLYSPLGYSKKFALLFLAVIYLCCFSFQMPFEYICLRLYIFHLKEIFDGCDWFNAVKRSLLWI